MPPGPALAAGLAGVDLATVPNDRLLAVLLAQHRQLCHEQARTAAVLAEIGRCASAYRPGEVARLAQPNPFGPEESRAALAWTSTAAYAEHALAETLVHALPAVFAAWSAGDLDRARVRIFDRYLAGLDPDLATRISTAALPRAPRLTTGQLDALLRRMVIAADPDAAARWYRRGLRERDVSAYLAPDGTVTLTGTGLPADEAEAACVRVQELAEAARRAGHPGRIGHIRAQVFLGLLDGRFHGMTVNEIIAALVATVEADAADRVGGSAAGDGQTDADGPGEGDSPGERVDPRAGDGSGEQDGSGAGDGSGERDGSGAGGDGPGRSGEDGGAPARDRQPRPDQGRGPVDDRRGIEIRVALSTLLGHDEHPADLPGLGPVPAPVARARVALQRHARWRFAVTDADGHLLSEGQTRRRPTRTRDEREGDRAGPGPRGGIVELHVPEALLTRLTADPAAAGPWAFVVADIAAQHAARDQHHADLDRHPHDRLPRPALRRHTEIRDRTCAHPCCRRRAHACQQDHTVDWAKGGATVRINIGPACPHDHAVKHEGGWWLEQPRPGLFIWHSPLGGRYPSRGEFLDPPLPPPAGNQHIDHRDDEPDPPVRHDEGPIRPRNPSRSRRWRAPPDPEEDIPPF